MYYYRYVEAEVSSWYALKREKCLCNKLKGNEKNQFKTGVYLLHVCVPQPTWKRRKKYEIVEIIING